MNKKLTDEELSELKELLTEKNRVALLVAVLGAIATVVSAIGTAVASIIVAIRVNGD